MMLVVALTLQGMVFALWVVVAFRTLLRLRARAVADSGGAPFPGLRATLDAFGAFARHPDHSADRKALAAVSAALAASMMVTFTLGQP
jgi:hypothetical protein